MGNKSITLFLLIMLYLAPVEVFAQDDHDHDHDHDTLATESQPTEHTDSHNDDHDDHAEADTHDDNDEHASEFVQLSAKELAEFGITLDTAGAGTVRNEILVPGEVAVNGDRIAHIVPRFTGVVKQVLKRTGDRVRTGDVLAIVESNEGLTPYNVTALMDGTVIDKQINVGEVHQGDSPAFIIADLDTVWVNLRVYQMHLGDVEEGQLAAITSDHGVHYDNGRISYVSPVVDEHTRTSTARVVLANPNGKWRPGLLVEGRIATDTYPVRIVVPKSAIFHMDDAEVVYVLTPEGFRAQPVRIGRTNHTNAEILSGLEAGEVFAASGGFTIKAEMQKGSFGDGHAH